MITLHAIHTRSWVELTDDQLVCLGDALMQWERVRIRLHSNGRTLIQAFMWRGWTNVEYPWYVNHSQRQRRLIKGRSELEMNRVHISRPSEER